MTQELTNTRQRNYFAWLPVRIIYPDYAETRWMERVTVEENRVIRENGTIRWVPVKFLEAR